MSADAVRRRALHAVQCATTLVVILGMIGLIAWAAGIATLTDIPWILAGAFGGSFAIALIRHDAKAPRRT